MTVWQLWFALVMFLVAEIRCVPISNNEHDEENTSFRQARSNLDSYAYDSYLSYEQMESRLKSLRFMYPDKIKLEVIGTTFEGRHIYGLTITDNVRRSSLNKNSIANDTDNSFRRNRRMPFVTLPLQEDSIHIQDSFVKRSQDIEIPRNFESGKPVIVIDGGIHAREWISPAAAFYIIDQLVKSPSLTSSLEWRIMPMLNPDGYVYSHLPGNRYWRKNRSPNVNSDCIGVDLNRNFDVYWNETVQEPCSDQYGGTGPFSENESSALKTVVDQVKDRLMAYVTIHSYGQLFLYPYGYTKAISPIGKPKLIRMGEGMANAIFKQYSNDYTVRQASAIGAAAGGSDDWVYISANIPYSYTFELQSKVNSGLSFGYKGFVLPEWKIKQAVDECWIAAEYMAKTIISETFATRVDNVVPEIASPDVIASPDSIDSLAEIASDMVTVSHIMRSNLPEVIWTEILNNGNVAKPSIVKNRASNISGTDCTVINSMYICPHMVFWNSMFTNSS